MVGGTNDGISADLQGRTNIISEASVGIPETIMYLKLMRTVTSDEGEEGWEHMRG